MQSGGRNARRTKRDVSRRVLTDREGKMQAAGTKAGKRGGTSGRKEKRLTDGETKERAA